MECWMFLVLALRFLIQYLQPTEDELDEETRRLHLEMRVKLLEEERIRLERTLEQLRQLQSGWAWGDLLWSPLQHGQLWAFSVLLLLLLALCFIWRKRSLRRDEHDEENDGANEEEGRNMDVNEEANVGNEEEVINEAGNAENNDDVNEVAVEDPDVDDNIGRIVTERIQWPVQDPQIGCGWTTLLMDYFVYYSRIVLSNGFYPVLEPAIGVGSAFEGWSPRGEDVEYQFLVPMTPPRGHSFHLEVANARQSHLRHFRVRVELECTCTREQQGENMLCFLHHPEEELRSNQDPSLLRTLCTDSYLDVQKTGRWFYQLLRAIWPALPHSHTWYLVPLPSTRSCQFKMTDGTDTYRIEMLFGVQRGNSDIFVTSQSGEPYTLTTSWLESYTVAEMKFFRHISRQAPPDSLHLKCLQFFTQLQLGLGFYTYMIKTIVMYLLNIRPVSQWRRRDFVKRILDISRALRISLKRKRLNHFILGNRRLPLWITLPQDVRMADTPNLFHHLATDPVAHSQAMSDYHILRERLGRILDTDN